MAPEGGQMGTTASERVRTCGHYPDLATTVDGRLPVSGPSRRVVVSSSGRPTKPGRLQAREGGGYRAQEP